MLVEIDQQVRVEPTYDVQRARSLYNVTDGQDTRFRLTVEVPLEIEPGWRIGVVVGPSGSGKTSVGRALSERAGWAEWQPKWGGGPILEEVGAKFERATGTLSAVGLGSVPSWLRPYGVLSNGERFRADMARLLLTEHRDVWLDEFTSVLDRQVAKVGAAAFAKAWRKQKAERRVVLLTPHYDILEWVEPDWVLDTKDGQEGEVKVPTWSEEVGGWSRPKVRLEVTEEGWRFWHSTFEQHHYLKAHPMAFSTAYVGWVGDEPVAHLGMSGMVSGKKREARACRMVVKPEWQGIGIGIPFLEALCERELRGEGFIGAPTTTILHTNHPALAVSLRRNPRWRQISQALHGGSKVKASGGGMGGHMRAVQGFRYGGERYAEAAEAAKAAREAGARDA
jgi:ABC-type ATPase with predicted acetyltransferase domain